MERTLSRLPHPQRIPGGLRRWWIGTYDPSQPRQACQIHRSRSARTSASSRNATPPLVYLLAGLTRRPPKPRAPPADRSVAPAPPAVPAEHSMPHPAAMPANQRKEPAPPRRWCPRLNPEQGQSHAIISPSATRPPHSANRSKMARTYPFTIEYNDCWGRRRTPSLSPVYV